MPTSEEEVKACFRYMLENPVGILKGHTMAITEERLSDMYALYCILRERIPPLNFGLVGVDKNANT